MKRTASVDYTSLAINLGIQAIVWVTWLTWFKWGWKVLLSIALTGLQVFAVGCWAFFAIPGLVKLGRRIRSDWQGNP